MTPTEPDPLSPEAIEDALSEAQYSSNPVIAFTLPALIEEVNRLRTERVEQVAKQAAVETEVARLRSLTVVYVLFRGNDHEGGGVKSIHATEAGAVTAAQAIMAEDEAREGEPRWRDGDADQARGVVRWWRALYRPIVQMIGHYENWRYGDIEETSDYMCVAAMTVGA